MRSQTELALLDAIRAAPSDDELRHVYADWLADDGQSDRSAFVRCQVEAEARSLGDARRIHYELDALELLERHEATWRKGLPTFEGVVWGRFRRGFIHKVLFATPRVFAERAAACLQAHPFESVVLPWPSLDSIPPPMPRLPGLRELTLFGSTSTRLVQWLAESPILMGVDTLNLVDNGLDDEALTVLAGSPYLSTLRVLRLPGLARSRARLRWLADSSLQLVELDLSKTISPRRPGPDPHELGIADMEGLSQWPGLITLRRLALSREHVRDDALEVLLASPSLRNLEALTLRANVHGSRAFTLASLERANASLRLAHLEVRAEALNEAATDHLNSAACLRDLRSFSLVVRHDRERIAPRVIRTAPWIRDLECITLPSTDSLAAVSQRTPDRLHSASVWNRADSRGRSEVDYAGLRSLQRLDIRHGREIPKALMSEDVLPNLVALRLNVAMLRPHRSHAMGKSPLMKHLRQFEMPQHPHHDRLPRPRLVRVDRYLHGPDARYVSPLMKPREGDVDHL